MSDRAGQIDLDELRLGLRLRSQLRRGRKAILRARARPDDETSIAKSTSARAVLVAVILIYVFHVGRLSLTNHWGFGMGGFDLGIFDQGMWLLSRFKDPFVTIMGVDLFGDHTSFILLPLVPFYWLHPSALILLVAQAVALGLAALPAFLLARDRLRDEVLAVGIAIAYVLHPAVGWTNLENFHPDAFEVPLALTALFFMFRKRWVPYFVFVVATMCVKEDVGLLVFGMGAYVALKLDRKVGLATMTLAVVWFLGNLLVILPAFNEQGTLDAWRIPAAEFGGRGGLIKAIFTRPWDVAEIALQDDKPLYMVQLLAPLAFIPLRAWGVALIAAGPLASNLMSTFFYQYQIEYHYTTMIVPVFIAAAIIGISRFHQRIRPILVGLTVVAAVGGAWAWGPFAGRYVMADPEAENVRHAKAALATIPDDAAVSSFWGYSAHLTHREQIYEFPVPWHARNWGSYEEDGEELDFADEVDVIVAPPDALSDDDRAIFEDLKSEFGVVYERDGIVIMERTNDG